MGIGSAEPPLNSPTVGIEAIRSFFASRFAPTGGEHQPDRVAIAACALLLEIAHADDVFTPEERDRVVRAVRELGVPEEDLREVLRLAEEVGFDPPVAAAAAEYFRRAMGTPLASADHTEVVTLLGEGFARVKENQE